MLPCFPESRHPEQPLPPQLQPEPPAQPKFPPSPTLPPRDYKQPKPWLAFILLPSFRGTSKAGVSCTLNLGPVGYFPAWNHRGEQPSPPAAGASPAQGTAALGHAPAPRPLCEGRVTSCPSLVLCWIPMDTSWAVGHRLTAQEPLTELLTEPLPTGTTAVYGNIHRLLQPSSCHCISMSLFYTSSQTGMFY